MPYGPRSLFSLSYHIRTYSTNLLGMELKYIPLFCIEPHNRVEDLQSYKEHSVSLLYSRAEEILGRSLLSKPTPPLSSSLFE